MAALVASRSRSIVHRVKNLNTLLINARHMSSNDSKSTADHIYHEIGDQDGTRVWPDRELLFNPYDQMRFPLPGNTAPGSLHVDSAPVQLSSSSLLLRTSSADVDAFLNSTSRYQTQAEVIDQYSTKHSDTAEKRVKEGKPSLDVELKVQDCPILMRKDFQRLFPGSDVMRGDFTVVSLCQRTDNDMTGWSEEVEEEREALIALYSETAKELCAVLHNSGFWADFIDPCSGKPHIGPHTTDTMFETDDRYRHFGFDIEDLGCCKVIKHHRWGTKSFVGCIFTNAPADSPVLTELTQFTDQKSEG